MDIKELYQKYKDKPQNGGAGFHTWQEEIFARIREKIEDDEEALALFDHTVSYAESKARVAGR